MHYDIRNVGYEYLQAEKCLKEKDIDGAKLHYQLAIDNYEYADNEYILEPDHEYSMVEDGVETNYPSLYFMREDAEYKLRKLKK